MDMVV